MSNSMTHLGKTTGEQSAKDTGTHTGKLTGMRTGRDGLQRVVAAALLSSTAWLTSGVAADTAVLAGGCFWCMEKDFEALDGVSEAVSGFTGGTAENPTYRGDHTGHFEAVEITYDPTVVTYQDLLEHFWVNVDPFDARGQFCDKGPSYLSAIFVADEDERALAERSKAQVVERFPEQTVVTPILPTATFYPIEGDEIHHQDFYRKSPVRYKAYRWGCRRDQRLREIWGDDATV